jgi:hypothetical protein
MNKIWENLNKPLFFGALALFLGSFLVFPSLLEDLKPKGPPIITRVFPVVDGPFTAYSNYVVKDSRTGLEWYYRHDSRAGGGVSSGSAREWANNLSVDGGGWRMPSLEELYGLYEAGSYNQGRKFGLENDWTGNRSPLLWKLESAHACEDSWIWSGDTIVEIRGVFLGSGVTHEIRTAKDGEKILYFNFNGGRGVGTGPNAAADNISLLLGMLSAKPVYAGAFAVR